VGRPAIDLLLTALFWLLNGFQYGVELHVAALIPGRREWLRRWPAALWLFYGLGFGYATAIMLASYPELAGSAVYAALNSAGGRLGLAIWFSAWPLGVVLLLAGAAWRWPRAIGRSQARLVLTGVLPWAILTLIISAFDIAGEEYPVWLEVGESIALLLYPLAVFVALYRYRLFNIEVVVRKSLVYTALTTTLVLLFYGALGVGGAVLSRFVADARASIWMVGGATLALGLLFAPLRRFFETQVEQRLFPHRSLLRDRLTDLAQSLPRKGRLQSICLHLVGELAEIFAVRHCTLLLAEGRGGLLVEAASSMPQGEEGKGRVATLMPLQDPLMELLEKEERPLCPAGWVSSSAVASQLTASGVERLVPILLQGCLAGLLLLGGKRDGEDYTVEETELLTLFSHHIAAVLDNARLFESATTDGLTGLLRREAILGELERELERARRYSRPLSVAMLDIDRFKKVNDDHGHLLGDLLLQRVAETLRRTLRKTDLVGRYGGEEFLLLFPETTLLGAHRISEGLRRNVARLKVETADQREVGVTISVGLASLHELPAGEPESPEALLRAADRSLYTAKREGRDRVVAAPEDR
jgi:diguanylate cyclase (GGDEF)-like protein